MIQTASKKPEPSPSAEIMQGWLTNDLTRYPVSYADAAYHLDMLGVISRYMAGVEAATKQQALKIAASLHSYNLPASNSDDLDEVIGGLIGIGEMMGGSAFIDTAVVWLQQMGNEQAAKKGQCGMTRAPTKKRKAKAVSGTHEIHVYLDPDVYQQIATLAEENDRSLTAQCRFMLQQAIRQGQSRIPG